MQKLIPANINEFAVLGTIILCINLSHYYGHTLYMYIMYMYMYILHVHVVRISYYN